jgi:O-antigen/teichoic acid export membrane protein
MSGPVTVATGSVAPPPPARLRALPAAVISAALLGVNVASYAFTALAARTLAPAAYGELAALMGILFIGVVPATAMQAAAALHLGRSRLDRAVDVRRVHATALVAGLGVGGLGLLATAPVVSLLHLTAGGAVGWLVLLVVPHTVVGGYEGLLQGTGRYGRLAVVSATFGVSKVAGGVAGLLLQRTPTGAMAGMAIGACCGALLGWLACGRPGVQRGLREPTAAMLRAAGALLGFVVLLNLDLLLARHYFPARVAGEYAVATLFAKIAFWLPQGVGVVLLPRLADPMERRRALPSALVVVATVGGLLTLGTAALGTRALPLVGGSAYGSALGSAAWLFAVLGSLLALAQLLVYSGIAAADRLAVATVWAAAAGECLIVAALAAAGLLSVVPLAVTALGMTGTTVVVGLVRALPRRAALRTRE